MFKRADVSPESKRLSPPMDSGNIKGVNVRRRPFQDREGSGETSWTVVLQYLYSLLTQRR